MNGKSKKYTLTLLLCGMLGACANAPRTLEQYDARKPEANNMALMGHVDLQARSAYHPEIKQQGTRWIAYVGHHGGVAKVNPLNAARSSTARPSSM